MTPEVSFGSSSMHTCTYEPLPTCTCAHMQTHIINKNKTLDSLDVTDSSTFWSWALSYPGPAGTLRMPGNLWIFLATSWHWKFPSSNLSPCQSPPALTSRGWPPNQASQSTLARRPGGVVATCRQPAWDVFHSGLRSLRKCGGGFIPGASPAPGKY